MKYQYDLQLHSTLSDGDWPIAKVVALAKKNGLLAISITDHDVPIQFDQKANIAKRVGIQHISGLEISTQMFGVEVHVLGYAETFNETILKKGLKKTISGYNQRVKQMIKKLGELGIVQLDFKKIKKAKGAPVAVRKYDLARAMAPILKIPVKQANQYLTPDGLAYLPYGRWAMFPTAAVRLLHEADGIAVLSHPGETYDKLVKKFGRIVGEKKFNQLVAMLLKYNLDGVEVYTPKNSTSIKKRCLRLARKHNLVVTGGSDWHGEKHHPELNMGDGGLTKALYRQFVAAIKKASQR